MRILLLGLGLVFVGCKEIKTPDGNLPVEAIEVAQELTGTYVGKFNGEPATIQFELEGSAPKVTFQTDAGSKDIIGDDCGSTIGDLRKVKIKEKKGSILARFQFDSGDCEIEDQFVSFAFKGNGKLKVEILKDYTLVYIPNHDLNIPLPDVSDLPTGSRDFEYFPNYLTGKFAKVQ